MNPSGLPIESVGPTFAHPNGESYAAFPRGPGVAAVITIRDHNGWPRVNLSEWAYRDGEWVCTRYGVEFRTAELVALLEALGVAADESWKREAAQAARCRSNGGAPTRAGGVPPRPTGGEGNNTRTPGAPQRGVPTRGFLPIASTGVPRGRLA